MTEGIIISGSPQVQTLNMKRYCYIVNNEIERLEALPINWNNISNFYVLSDDTLKTYGWLPLEEQQPGGDLTSGYHILTDKVIYVAEPPVEQNNNQSIEALWREVRNKRDQLLQETDKFMLIDTYEQLNAETQQQYKTYRQQLRDIPQTFELPENVVWPVLSTQEPENVQEPQEDVNEFS